MFNDMGIYSGMSFIIGGFLKLVQFEKDKSILELKTATELTASNEIGTYGYIRTGLYSSNYKKLVGTSEDIDQSIIAMRKQIHQLYDIKTSNKDCNGQLVQTLSSESNLISDSGKQFYGPMYMNLRINQNAKPDLRKRVSILQQWRENIWENEDEPKLMADQFRIGGRDSKIMLSENFYKDLPFNRLSQSIIQEKNNNVNVNVNNENNSSQNIEKTLTGKQITHDGVLNGQIFTIIGVIEENKIIDYSSRNYNSIKNMLCPSSTKYSCVTTETFPQLLLRETNYTTWLKWLSNTAITVGTIGILGGIGNRISYNSRDNQEYN